MTSNKAIQDRIFPGLVQAIGPVVGGETHPFSGPMPVLPEELWFQGRRIRVVAVGEAVQFVATDVAAILQYANARQAVRIHVSKCNRDGVYLTDTIGRTQRLTTVNEAGLYELILGSEKPTARKFRAWVVEKVLPAIRKTGRYEIEGTQPLLMEQISVALRGRGAAKERQLNRVIAHRDGTFSIRVGRSWMRHIPALQGDIPVSHSLREGQALGAIRSAGHTLAVVQ
jgi:prophage antirepressor-like protein